MMLDWIHSQIRWDVVIKSIDLYGCFFDLVECTQKHMLAPLLIYMDKRRRTEYVIFVGNNLGASEDRFDIIFLTLSRGIGDLPHEKWGVSYQTGPTDVIVWDLWLLQVFITFSEQNSSSVLSSSMEGDTSLFQYSCELQTWQWCENIEKIYAIFGLVVRLSNWIERCFLNLTPKLLYLPNGLLSRNTNIHNSRQLRELVSQYQW